MDKQLLQDWHDHMVTLDKTYGQYNRLIDIESDLMDAVFRLTDHYTRIVAKQLNVDDEWLYWWHLECELGKRPMTAWVFGDAYKCNSLKDLVEILEVDST